MDLKSNDKPPYNRHKRSNHRGEGHLTTAADIRVSSHKPRNASLYQKLEEARTKSTLEPLEGAQASQELDFGLLASTTGRVYISIVLSYRVCGHLLQQLQETHIFWFPHCKIEGIIIPTSLSCCDDQMK